MRYFVASESLRTDALKMELLLTRWFREHYEHCVLNDTAVNEALTRLRVEQSRILQENGRLRTVEISWRPSREYDRYPVFLHIGGTPIPLYPVQAEFDE